MVFIVIFEPSGELVERGLGNRQRVHPHIVALAGLYERLAEAIALRAGDWREARHQIDLSGKSACFDGGVGRPIVGQPFHGMGSADVTEPRLHRQQHDVADDRPADPGISHSNPGDDLTVTGIDGKADPDDLAVPAGELESIGAPAQV